MQAEAVEDFFLLVALLALEALAVVVMELKLVEMVVLAGVLVGDTRLRVHGLAGVRVVGEFSSLVMSKPRMRVSMSSWSVALSNNQA